MTAGGTAVITGMLRQKWIDAFASEQEQHATSARLAAALDQVDIGIVLLDADTRAEFINRAFRDYFSLPDEKADSKPPFIALMYHGRDTGAYELPEDELAAFIAKRTEMMRSGDSTPININLADGQVLRLSCTALPDGGRMLSYTPVTDLVRHSDGPAMPNMSARCAAATACCPGNCARQNRRRARAGLIPCSCACRKAGLPPPCASTSPPLHWNQPCPATSQCASSPARITKNGFLCGMATTPSTAGRDQRRWRRRSRR